MKDRAPLDDLLLFLAVADGGGLGGAARATGVSAPTLSRRMAALERRMGHRLFDRGARGYALTARGRALREEAADLIPLERRLARWGRDDRAPRVRITAGTWTSRLLAVRLAGLDPGAAGWTPEFMASNADLDIARREADVGLRNRRPEQPWLAGRRLRRVDYAPYGADPDRTGWITLPPGGPTTPSDRWIKAHHAGEVVTTASDARLAADLAAAGLGRVLLPVFAGDALPGLRRLGPPIADLGHHEWLVVHHEARHDPPVRAAIDHITAAMTEEEP